MQFLIVRVLRVITLCCLMALISATVYSPACAADKAAKPIQLVTGKLQLNTVSPAQAKAAPKKSYRGKYFKLIQFHKIPGEVDQKSMKQGGLHLVDYISDNTYFAVIEEGKGKGPSKTPGFDLMSLSSKTSTIVDIPDAVRLEPKLIALRAQGKSTNGLVVSYYGSLNAQEVITDLQALGVTIKNHRDYSRQLDITFDPALLEKIIALPYLQFLGLVPEEPVLEGYDHRNASSRTNYLNTGFNSLNYNGSGVVVAIGEGGTVDGDGPVDAKGRLTEMTTGGPSSHKIGVLQNAGGAGNLDPSNRNNAWGATYLSVVGNPNYATLYSSHNLRYTNHSYGVSIAGGYDQGARDHDLRIASLPNHLVIYSAGNSGDEKGFSPYDFSGCPADLTQCWANITGQMKQNKNMLGIGALSPEDVLTSFSSRGPMYDGRIFPQLVTEGIEGTSDAAPKVTGYTAILAQIYKAKTGGAEPPSSLLRAVLMNTADDMDDPGPDYKTGYGRVNMRRAYNLIDKGQYLTSSVPNGGSNSHTITVPTDTKQMRVMIVWPDAAAAVNAATALVNDINLSATAPSSASYNPWVLDPTATVAAVDAPATRGVDNRNTIEQVTVDNPETGNWTIAVNGFNVPKGPQTYYLVYEFLMDELHMGFPLKDHRFVSGTAYHLKWDSYGASDTFSLDYRLDGGQWVSIKSGYDATSRTYNWTAPAVTGIHTIEFRVQRGALTATSEVNYIGNTPEPVQLLWSCNDGVKLTWKAVAGATAYNVYRLGANYMEKVTGNITFDGTSALLTGQSTTSDEYYAVSAVTGTYEGKPTMALKKITGDFQCTSVTTKLPRSVDETDITFRGGINPHNSALSNVRFEYGSTTAYGSVTPVIATSATGHTDEAVSSSVPSILGDRTNVLHYRLVADKDGVPVVGVDQEIVLPSGSAFTFDGTDDYLNLSEHPDLPIYQSGAGKGYTIAFWIKAPTSPANGQIIYAEDGSSGTLRFQTYSWFGGTGLYVYLSSGTTPINDVFDLQLLNNTWHHFAWVDANGSVKMYVDGIQKSVKNYTPPGSMTLSKAGFGALNGASNFSTGTLDEMSFWDKALTQAEVQNLMHKPLEGDEANLKAFYRLDDGPAGRVIDVVQDKAATIGGTNVTGGKVLSTAPIGVAGTLVQTTNPTTVGGTGKQMTVDITSASPTTNYLGIYKTGSGDWLISGETFPADVTRRASIIWGIREFGTVTANLILDYSNVSSITDPATVKLLKRQDAASPWVDVTANFAHNTTSRTFTGTGLTEFSEFAIGANVPTAVIVGRVSLGDMSFNEYLGGMGAADPGREELLRLLRAWVPETADLLADATRETLLDALRDYLDQDGDGRVVVLQWDTVEERGTIGFYVERMVNQEQEQGAWQRLDNDMLPGLITAPLGGSYWLVDPEAQPGVNYQYRLIELEAGGAQNIYGPYPLNLR